MTSKIFILFALASFCLFSTLNAAEADWEVLNFAISNPGESNPEILKNSVLNILQGFIPKPAPRPATTQRPTPKTTTTATTPRPTTPCPLMPPVQIPAVPAPPAPQWPPQITILSPSGSPATPQNPNIIQFPPFWNQQPSDPSKPSGPIYIQFPSDLLNNRPSAPSPPAPQPSIPPRPSTSIQTLQPGQNSQLATISISPPRPAPCSCNQPAPCNCKKPAPCEQNLGEFVVNVPCPPTTEKPIREIIVKVPRPTTKKPCECKCCPCNPCKSSKKKVVMKESSDESESHEVKKVYKPYDPVIKQYVNSHHHEAMKRIESKPTFKRISYDSHEDDD